MKHKKDYALFIILILGYLIGCQNDVTDVTNEEIYTVWTNAITDSEFQSACGISTTDGYYVNVEENSSILWDLSEKLSSLLSNKDPHYWTKSKIKDWFIGRGFGESESTQEAAWITTVNHGFVVSRTRGTVYYILK
jgi:hypothetical protein